jgi:hypothetical protein
MASIRRMAIAAGLTLGITLSLVLSVTLTVLFIVGWRTERETADTTLSFETAARVERHTERKVEEGGNPTQQTPPAEPATKSPPRTSGTDRDSSRPYVGGNYVSARSTMRYVIEDAEGGIKIYGYDVMRGRRVFLGSGRMMGRRLLIPNFYSFLDDTYGTLKVDVSEDGQTLEGRFEGIDATREGPVTLVRLP